MQYHNIWNFGAMGVGAVLSGALELAVILSRSAKEPSIWDMTFSSIGVAVFGATSVSAAFRAVELCRRIRERRNWSSDASLCYRGVYFSLPNYDPALMHRQNRPAATGLCYRGAFELTADATSPSEHDRTDQPVHNSLCYRGLPYRKIHRFSCAVGAGKIFRKRTPIHHALSSAMS